MQSYVSTFRYSCHCVLQKALTTVAIVVLLGTSEDGSIWRLEIGLHLHIAADAGRIWDNGVGVALSGALS